MILDEEALRELRNYRCSECGKRTQKLYLKRVSQKVGEFKYNIILSAICEDCENTN